MERNSKAEKYISEIKKLNREDINRILLGITEALEDLAIQKATTVFDRYRNPIKVGDIVEAFTHSSFQNHLHPLHGRKPKGRVVGIEVKKEKGDSRTWVLFKDTITDITVWRLPKNVVLIIDKDEYSDARSECTR